MVSGLKALAGSARVRGAALAVAVFGLMLAGQTFAWGAGGVVKVRIGGDQRTTRVVVELDRSATGKVLGDDPGKVVLALNGVGSESMRGRGQGLVREWSAEGAGQARVKLAVSRPVTVKRRFLLPPGDGVSVYRYVMDLEATGEAVPASTAPARTTRAADRHGRRIIVVDAGHGGHDPGAQGANNHEKALTLAAARALKARLERTGRYTVVLTRSDDTYVGLERRVAIARQADADLFISLHADSVGDSSLRGASVYTLSERGAERAARRFAGENWVHDGSLGRDPVVTRILLDLTQRATTNRSAVFARVLLDQIADDTLLLNRSHRDAGFAVLLAPDVPAVLLEMGFITNPQDERALADPRRRERLVGGIADAVDAYFAEGGQYAGLTGGL
ncbi:MAG: N-acetylmuramoyl-L-alanine amidase [Caulobacteraceae bacterium]|nr:N-acetylmuramoyl-L-alanine amidase [Caulobacteraceae bacterium]